MQRLRDYLRIVAWQTGIGYLLLWAVALWTLEDGARVFGKSGVCHPDAAEVLFYWVCEGASPFAILAAVANAALTATFWAPVYLAVATVQPAAVPLAAFIIALHLAGLPLGLFVLTRLGAMLLDLVRSGRAPPPVPAKPAPSRPATTAEARPAR
jgi:hypothetical protein